MKKTLLLAMVCTTSTCLAVDPNLEALQKFRASKPVTQATVSSQSSGPSQTLSVVENGRCGENFQTSLPLAYLENLSLEKTKIDTSFDASRGKLTVTTPSIINNCSSMFALSLNKKKFNDGPAYVVSANFIKGKECDDRRCLYNVGVFEDGKIVNKDLAFSNDMAGFFECMNAAGVMKNGEVVASAVDAGRIKTTFPDKIDSSARLLFGSHGPQSFQSRDSKDWVSIEGCDHYEVLDSERPKIVSLEDQQAADNAAERAKVEACGVYSKINDFIQSTSGANDDLIVIRNKLILEATQATAAKIEAGKYEGKDLQVIADFDRYIVEPIVKDITLLYDQLEIASGEQKDAIMAQIKELESQLKVYNKQPYFTAKQTKKLIDAGNFDEAEELGGLKLTMTAYASVGQKQNNVLIDPSVADKKVMADKRMFARQLAKEKENYEVRTGQITGESDYYTKLTRSMQTNVQVRSQNFNREIASEYQRMSPGGYCYASPYRNVQRCVADSQSRISELQALLQHYNRVDLERAQEYEQKAKEYGALEVEGRRYIAQQNGEEEVPAPQQQPTTNTTLAPPQGSYQDNSSYQFQWNGGQQGQAQPIVQAQPSPYYPQQAQLGAQAYAPYSNIGGQGNNLYQNTGYQYNAGYQGQVAPNLGYNYNYSYYR